MKHPETSGVASRKDVRSAFSLLEVMLATALLAASAMILSSLIGLGATFGNRAELRTRAVAVAQSVLDETLARLGQAETLDNLSGEVVGNPTLYFDVSLQPMSLGSESSSPSDVSPLLRVRVDVSDSPSDVGSTDSESVKNLCSLTMIVRARRSPVPQ
jgi:type II secretory pathway pseudopilin PulG